MHNSNSVQRSPRYVTLRYNDSRTTGIAAIYNPIWPIAPYTVAQSRPSRGPCRPSTAT